MVASLCGWIVFKRADSSAVNPLHLVVLCVFLQSGLCHVCLLLLTLYANIRSYVTLGYDPLLF